MRMTSLWLLGVTGCFHGNVVIRPAHIAAVAEGLRAHGSVELDASVEERDDGWEATRATLRLDDRVDVAFTPAPSAVAAPASAPTPAAAADSTAAAPTTIAAPAPPVTAPPVDAGRAGTAATARVGARLSVRELLADCPPNEFRLDAATRAEYPRCALLAVKDQPIVIGRRRIAEGATLDAGVGLALLGGLFVCAYECDRPWSRVSGGVLITTGVLAVLSGLGAVATISNLGKH